MAKEIQGMIEFLQQSGRFLVARWQKKGFVGRFSNSTWNLSLGQRQPGTSAGARFGIVK